MMNNPQDALTLFYSRLSAAGKGINWLLACRPDELSQDGDPNGVFTNTVLTGLNGKAETNSDNIVTLGELTSYLDKRFEQFNIENRDRKYQNGKPVRMTPQFFGNGNTSIPLAVLYKSMQ